MSRYRTLIGDQAYVIAKLERKTALEEVEQDFPVLGRAVALQG